METHPKIFLARGRQVVMASDLASLFGVAPKRLNEQVRRNERRFPSDFGFRLTREEFENLRPHFAASSFRHGGHRYPPFVVTEYGVVMLANVLSSPRAIAMSVQVVRDFIRLRTIGRSGDSLKKRLRLLALAMKSRLEVHESKIEELFEAVESLIAPPGMDDRKRRIGFVPDKG